MDFYFWLAADHHALALAHSNFAYVKTACLETVYLPANALPRDTPRQLRKTPATQRALVADNS